MAWLGMLGAAPVMTLTSPDPARGLEGESLRKEFILSLSVLCDPSTGAGVFTLARCHPQLITLSLSLNQEKKYWS